MIGSRPALSRQVVLFVLIGLAQLALDSALYIGLTAAGLSVAVGNVTGRVAGACLGFWLNGRYTFADNGRARLQRRHLLRFVIAWSALTVVSTWLMATIAGWAGLQGSWLAKPLVEVGMAAVGFVVWRQWVYR